MFWTDTKMRITYLFILVLIIFSSCNPTPNFPDNPVISLENIYFVEGNTDSLVVSLSFEDGDGDLGLNTINYPFHEFNYYSSVDGKELHKKASESSGKTIIDFLPELITFAHKRTGEIDTLPPYTEPFSCTRWKTNAVIPPFVFEDTLYYQRNPSYYNIFITFLVKETVNSKFEVLDFDQIGCAFNSYNGRFPRMLDEDNEKALEGVITYKMPGILLSDILERKIIKLKIQVFDRALNRSNVVETQEFILSEITI